MVGGEPRTSAERMMLRVRGDRRNSEYAWSERSEMPYYDDVPISVTPNHERWLGATFELSGVEVRASSKWISDRPVGLNFRESATSASSGVVHDPAGGRAGGSPRPSGPVRPARR